MTSTQSPGTLPTSESGSYTIAVASRRSGVRQETLRAWERRHQALRPSRTEGGHRLYSDNDVERLRLLRLATAAGHRIGQVAGLDDAALVDLLRDDARAAEEAAPSDTSGGVAGDDADTGDPVVASCLRAIEDLDATALLRALEEASVHLSRVALVDRVLAPLVEAIGSGYDQGRLRPAHEHLATATVTAFVQTFRAALPVPPSSPCLIAATPAHQHHELGAVLAGAVAASEGWQVIHLGPNLPAEDIAAAAHWKSAAVVALSLVFPPDDRLLVDEIRRLRRLLDRRVALVVGGRATAAYAAVLDEVAAVRVADFASLRRLLAELRAARAASELDSGERR